MTGPVMIVMSALRPIPLQAQMSLSFGLTLRAEEETNMHHEPETPPVLDQSFPTDPTGLPEAAVPQLLELADGDTVSLRVAPVAKRLGDSNVRMLGYNGSIPGPTLRVRQGSEVIVP